VPAAVAVTFGFGVAAGKLRASSASSPASSSAEQGVPTQDRVRIAEAFAVVDELGEKIWRGWSDAPRAVLLVTRDREYLVHHPYPTGDFTRVGYDSLLQSDVYTRERVYDPKLLATFPAVAGVPTIVIGQPQNTNASHSTRWVMTLLHEHFHQWQLSQPGYYDAVNGLGLARGDTTGMWMLNYDFPYETREVEVAFSYLCRSAAVAVKTSSEASVREYLAAKGRFRQLLDADDYAYFSFQIWQEGIARYTEVRLAESAGVSYRPTHRFESLEDFRPFARDAEETRAHLLSELSRVSLADSRRVAFYHIGAAEALLLDRVNSRWQADYFSRKFFTDNYFPEKMR
jgi:hypothetical protein